VIVTNGKTISDDGTLPADVTGSRTIPHLTRLTRRVYVNAGPEVLGMTLKQLAILASLRDRGDLPQQMLCDVLHTTQNTVVVWLNELEDAGLVVRARDPEDRRKHNVAITSAGSAALERAEAELRRLEDEALVGLTADERAQLRTLLAKALAAAT
jgi:DNA-binding MarR family transcriptional regulator